MGASRGRKAATTIDIEDERVCAELKRLAGVDRRTLKAYVNVLLERHCGFVGQATRSEEIEEPSGAEALVARVNEVLSQRGVGTLKTGRQLAMEREERRGNEGGSQIRDDDADHPF